MNAKKEKNVLFSSITLMLCIFVFPGLYSQTININEQRKCKKNSIFAELYGNAGTLSLNYERFLESSSDLSFTFSLGGGYLAGYYGFRETIGYQISSNVLFSKNRNVAEAGIGLTYNVGILQAKYRNIDNNIEYFPSKGFYFLFRVGYRYYVYKVHTYVRFGLTPYLKLHEFSKTFKGNLESKKVLFLPAVSLGYFF